MLQLDIEEEEEVLKGIIKSNRIANAAEAYKIVNAKRKKRLLPVSRRIIDQILNVPEGFYLRNKSGVLVRHRSIMGSKGIERIKNAFAGILYYQRTMNFAKLRHEVEMRNRYEPGLFIKAEAHKRQIDNTASAIVTGVGIVAAEHKKRKKRKE